MTKNEFKQLDTGDIVRSLATNIAYVVSANYGNRVTAVKTVDMTNPQEWSLIAKAEHKDNN
jgi:hypothetical protein